MITKRILCGALASAAICCLTACGKDKSSDSKPSKKKAGEYTTSSNSSASSFMKAVNTGMTDLDAAGKADFTDTGWYDAKGRKVVGGDIKEAEFAKLFDTCCSKNGVDYNYITNYFEGLDDLDEAYIYCVDWCCVGSAVLYDDYWGTYPAGLVDYDDARNGKVDLQYCMNAVEDKIAADKAKYE